MTAVDFGKYKRIVQYFWDPEPTNDTAARSPIWCLGKEYKVSPKQQPLDTTSASLPNIKSASTSRPAKPATPPDSTASSIDSGLAYDEQDGGGGWPAPFLDDFEARIWLTYRSNFPTIPKSQDPKAASAMSLSVRLRSQLVDQAGFTSDTGWGCMIRSGQSLLANALVMLRMGRGQEYRHRLFFYITDGLRRLASGFCEPGRTRDHIIICRQSESPLLYSQVRRAWSYCLWETSRGVVRAFGNGTLYTVKILSPWQYAVVTNRFPEH